MLLSLTFLASNSFNGCEFVGPCKFPSAFDEISPLKLPGVPASVQVGSLHCLSYLCSQSEEGLHVQLVAEFPSILVPLASDDKVINPFA